jgi:hypothetical protein
VVRNGFHRNPSGAVLLFLCASNIVQFDAPEQVNRQSSNLQTNETQEERRLPRISGIESGQPRFDSIPIAPDQEGEK